MPANQSLRDGDLRGALSQLQQQIKGDPANVAHRVYLFQLFSVMGSWGRALTQLNVAGDLDAGTLAMVQTYREALRCEAFRAEVFTGKRSPMIFGDPEQWIALCVQALGLAANEQPEEAAQLREQAYESAPLTTGTIDGDAFEWIADADSRIGPFLEAIVNGTYYWIPFHRIQRLGLEQPEDLRDLVWAPAQFTWSNGGQAVGFIPSRYPGSEANEDSQIQLARKTEWIDKGGDEYIGCGQRMLATDAAEYSLLNIREIVLDTAVE
jgi:type VI secretion system protein ImpE